MNDIKQKNNIFKKSQTLITNNIKLILIFTSLILVCFISFQIYLYYSQEKIKKTSIVFFNLINEKDDIIENLNDITKDDNIYSILSVLKIIENNNKNSKYDFSNDLYKELVFNKDLDELYKSSISAHAAYTMINASYNENKIIYLEDISKYIDNISGNLENYFSIKKELEYLLIVTEIDLKNIDYKSDSRALKLYDEIINSELISLTIKERVKKIHEFQLYK
jgi:hypothetical protein